MMILTFEKNIVVDSKRLTSNPCCVDDCKNQPTFRIGILVDDIYKRSVFICKSHYRTGQLLPGKLLLESRTLTRLVKGN